MNPYTNFSSIAKCIDVYCLNLETLVITKYNSIASLVKELHNSCLNFNSECAIVSDKITKGGIYQCKYLVSNTDNQFSFAKRHIQIYNTFNKKYYENAKIAAKEFKCNKNTIRKYCKDLKNKE